MEWRKIIKRKQIHFKSIYIFFLFPTTASKKTSIQDERTKTTDKVALNSETVAALVGMFSWMFLQAQTAKCFSELLDEQASIVAKLFIFSNLSTVIMITIYIKHQSFEYLAQLCRLKFYCCEFSHGLMFLRNAFGERMKKKNLLTLDWCFARNMQSGWCNEGKKLFQLWQPATATIKLNSIQFSLSLSLANNLFRMQLIRKWKMITMSFRQQSKST